eukprot:scaffold87769_cov57-Phaeocystis_antarctica.AAC.1
MYVYLEGGGIAHHHAVPRELPVAQVLEQQLAQLARLLDAAEGDDAHRGRGVLAAIAQPRRQVAHQRERLDRVHLALLHAARHAHVEEGRLHALRARRQAARQKPAVVELGVGEGDARGDAAEVLGEGDPRVGVAGVGQVEDRPAGQQLLDVRVARGEEARLELADARLRHEGGRGRDLLAVADHEHLGAAQQRGQRRHVRLRGLVEHHQVEGGRHGRKALRDAPGGHDPARDGGRALEQRRGEVRAVAGRARAVALRGARLRDGRDEAHQPCTGLGRELLAQLALGARRHQLAHRRLPLEHQPLRRARRAALRRRVACLGASQCGARRGRRPQPARVGGARVEVRRRVGPQHVCRPRRRVELLGGDLQRAQVRHRLAHRAQPRPGLEELADGPILLGR